MPWCESSSSFSLSLSISLCCRFELCVAFFAALSTHPPDAGMTVPIKPIAQLKGTARECIEHIVVLCSWINDEVGSGADVIASNKVSGCGGATRWDPALM
jgi:hypothetical protein